MSEELIELPESWLQTEVRSISTVVTGKTPSTSNEAFWNGEIPFITPAQIDPLGSILPPNKTLTNLGAAQGRIIPENSILAVCIGTVGKIGLLDRPAVVNQQLNAMVPDRRISAKFLYYWAQYFLRPWIIANASATVNAAILNKSRLEIAPVLLAPIAEQKRIVAKIEELRSKTQKAREALEAIPEMCDRFRQSVLAAAFRGDLTTDWREENPNASSLDFLAQKDIKIAEQKNFAELPEGWTWVLAGELCQIKSGVALGKKRASNAELLELPYLRVANVQRGWLDLSEIKTIFVTPKEAEALYLKYGDILMNEGGDRDKLGRGWIWENEISPCIHQNHVFRLRLKSPEVPPKYISCFANEFGQKYFMNQGKQTTNLASISMSKLSAFPIPIAPPDEMKLILERITDRFSCIDRIQQQYEAAKAQLEKLDRAILAKAFQGELVPQDPNDEPASVLLERIREERSKSSDRKSTKRKR